MVFVRRRWVPAQNGVSERRAPMRRRFRGVRDAYGNYALIEASTEDEALSTGTAVFERLVGADPYACAVFDYFVTFDDEDTTVAGKARWATSRLRRPSIPKKGKSCSIGVGKQRKRSSSVISTR